MEFHWKPGCLNKVTTSVKQPCNQIMGCREMSVLIRSPLFPTTYLKKQEHRLLIQGDRGAGLLYNGLIHDPCHKQSLLFFFQETVVGKLTTFKTVLNYVYDLFQKFFFKRFVCKGPNFHIFTEMICDIHSMASICLFFS